MTAATVAPDACTAWLDSFQALPLAERKWVIDFITDQSPDDIGADVAARLRELYDLPPDYQEVPMGSDVQELADGFGVGGPS